MQGPAHRAPCAPPASSPPLTPPSSSPPSPQAWSLDEFNKKIARSKEEYALFTRLDTDIEWPGPLQGPGDMPQYEYLNYTQAEVDYVSRDFFGVTWGFQGCSVLGAVPQLHTGGGRLRQRSP